MSPTSRPLPTTRSPRRDPDVSERAAAALLAELKHPSLLVRHIALCRLLHGGVYREFTPEALRSVATHLSVAADHDASAVRLLSRIATLQRAEQVTARALGSVATGSATNGVSGLAAGDDSVRVLFAAAVAELGEHGYRTVCGRQSVSPDAPLSAAASSLTH